MTDMTGGGPFRLPAGAWTDDTSMAMCLAESLVECHGFDPVDQLTRYVRWYREGYWSSTGSCFDIGNATRAALERFERTGQPFPGDAAPTAAGNGPLMKLAPVAMFYAHDPDEADRRAAESARTTHGAPEAIDASRYFARLLSAALTETPAADLHPHGGQINGGGYVLDALASALWAVDTTTTFEDAILKAVNLGNDADTTAAIAGQLAGARYGVTAIPKRWLDKLVRRDQIAALADALRDR